MGEQKGNFGKGHGKPRPSYSLSTGNPFLNPYNFVSTTAPEQSVDAESQSGATHTGYLECQLITRTPLAIPDVENKTTSMAHGKEHDVYPFMSIDGEYVIPGSSIRGVIRSIYETVTNSCMVTVAGDDVITARTEATKAFLPGILKRDKEGWKLYAALHLTVRCRLSLIPVDHDIAEYILFLSLVQ